MSEESPMGAAPPPPPKTTTASGAAMIEVSPWLTAAVVAAYATKALWVKLRHVASAARKQKLLKNEPSLKLEENENANENESAEETKSEYECDAGHEEAPDIGQDEMLKHFESDTGPVTRSIEL
ncbi:hypothetical protein KR054_003250 [Drosophila jambulina]|nr:hypothetical protein KR054_003250 [Drosophila jambulina]